MKKRFLHLVFPAIALILEILPYGAVCNFANPDGKPWRETFSYFSLIPFGYAHFAPFLTAVITCIICLLIALYCFNGSIKIKSIAKTLLFIAVVLSLYPLILGISFFSVTGAFITLSLAAELALLHFIK
jgi:hypothetical protein